MTYSELYENVRANLSSRTHFTIQVQTTHSSGHVETEWEVWIDHNDGECGGIYEGATPAEAFADYIGAQQTVAETSAAVGDAVVEA